MELGQQWCDNATCPDYGKVGAGNIRAFSYVARRYYCATCRHTFSADKHAFFETLRCPRATVLEALALLVERNSLRAAARLTHHSPNRVLHWLALAGQHGAVVSAALIRDLSLTQVQIDELWTFVQKKVHPAEACAAERWMTIRSSDQFVSRLVDRQDLQLEELLVAEPISLPLHRLDLVVRPLHRTGRDHHVVVGQQPTPVRRQCLAHLLAHLDPRRLRTLDPAVEE